MRRALVPVGAIAMAALLVFAFLPSGGKQTLHLTFSGLPPLANGHYYEGWAIIDGEDWSTGRFNVGPDGELVALDGEATGGDYDAGIDLTETTLVAITRHTPLDAMGKDTTGTVVPHLISGAVADLEAPLSVHGVGALNATFAGASALVTLHEGGFDLSNITLPGLRGGWVYQAWVEVGGTAISLGRFGGATSFGKAETMAKAEMMAKAAMETAAGAHDSGDEGTADASDHDAHGATGGSSGYPAIHGAIGPSGGSVFITVEAGNDDSPAPYAVYALSVEIPAEAVEGSEHALVPPTLGLPTGWAVIH